MIPATTSSGLRGFIGAAIFGVLAQSLSVVSAAESGSVSRTVKFADLNISNPSGAHELYGRIRAAAQVVCSYHWFATDTDKARWRVGIMCPDLTESAIPFKRSATWAGTLVFRARS